jgi:hypothetical protein
MLNISYTGVFLRFCCFVVLMIGGVYVCLFFLSFFFLWEVFFGFDVLILYLLSSGCINHSVGYIWARRFFVYSVSGWWIGVWGPNAISHVTAEMESQLLTPPEFQLRVSPHLNQAHTFSTANSHGHGVTNALPCHGLVLLHSLSSEKVMMHISTLAIVRSPMACNPACLPSAFVRP